MTITTEYLQTDVVRAGLAVRVNAYANRVFVTVRDEGVAESVRSATHEVLVVKAETAPTVFVVLETGVKGQVLVGSAQELLTTLSENDRLLDGQELVAQQRSRGVGVFGRHQVRKGAVGERRRESEHLGA